MAANDDVDHDISSSDDDVWGGDRDSDYVPDLSEEETTIIFIRRVKGEWCIKIIKRNTKKKKINKLIQWNVKWITFSCKIRGKSLTSGKINYFMTTKYYFKCAEPHTYCARKNMSLLQFFL